MSEPTACLGSLLVIPRLTQPLDYLLIDLLCLLPSFFQHSFHFLLFICLYLVVIETGSETHQKQVAAVKGYLGGLVLALDHEKIGG
jgi:hypothetical protein